MQDAEKIPRQKFNSSISLSIYKYQQQQTNNAATFLTLHVQQFTAKQARRIDENLSSQMLLPFATG